MFIENKMKKTRSLVSAIMNDIFMEPLEPENEVCEISCEELERIKKMAEPELHMYDGVRFNEVSIHSELLF